MNGKKCIFSRRNLVVLIAVLCLVLLGLLIYAGSLSAGENGPPGAAEAAPSTAGQTMSTQTVPDPETAESGFEETRQTESQAAEIPTMGTTEPIQPSTTESTQAPTTEPAQVPTTEPTQAPTTEPTQVPTTEPTQAPTTEPTQSPTTEPPAPPPTTAPPATEESRPAKPEPVVYSSFSAFSGQFVEDGTDRMVSNVAAILVTNQSDQFMDLATLTFTLDGKTATFVVTGLPAGRSAWVMESTAMTVTADSELTFVDCVSSLRDGVSAQSEVVTVTAQGNVLTAVNNSDKTLENVFIYYKQARADGSFFGGITYLVDFGTLAPGGSARKEAPHFAEGISEIVRIGWME